MPKTNLEKKVFYPKSIGFTKPRILNSLNYAVEILNSELEKGQKPFRNLTIKDLTDKKCQEYTNMYFLKEDDLFCEADIDQDDEIGEEERQFVIKLLTN